MSHLTGAEQALIVAGIAATASITVAVLGAIFAYFAGRRDRRRVLYGEACRAALAWQEMVYRVRRRQPTNEVALVERFHDMQEQLAYYQGWIASESKYMERSYRRLVTKIKAATQPLIAEAWGHPIRAIGSGPAEDDQHVSFQSDIDRFLKDVRAHLSPMPWRKIAVAWRNRESAR